MSKSTEYNIQGFLSCNYFITSQKVGSMITFGLNISQVALSSTLNVFAYYIRCIISNSQMIHNSPHCHHPWLLPHTNCSFIMNSIVGTHGWLRFVPLSIMMVDYASFLSPSWWREERSVINPGFRRCMNSSFDPFHPPQVNFDLMKFDKVTRFNKKHWITMGLKEVVDSIEFKCILFCDGGSKMCA